MSTQTFQNAEVTTPFASELGSASVADFFQHLLIATLALTLVLATMGNLGASALIVGPVMAAALVLGRALLTVHNPAEEVNI